MRGRARLQREIQRHPCAEAEPVSGTLGRLVAQAPGPHRVRPAKRKLDDGEPSDLVRGRGESGACLRRLNDDRDAGEGRTIGPAYGAQDRRVGGLRRGAVREPERGERAEHHQRDGQ